LGLGGEGYFTHLFSLKWAFSVRHWSEKLTTENRGVIYVG
jgi:hypothetical protein